MGCAASTPRAGSRDDSSELDEPSPKPRHRGADRGQRFVQRRLSVTDEDLRAAVTRHAGMRGLTLEPAALGYLLQRVSRDLGELTVLLDRIDDYALAAQRKITIPLLREVIRA